MNTPETTILYRPVGQAELDLIAQGGFAAFPPRLPGQPLFYPVLDESYAVQIARDWNTKDAASGYTGYVLKFAVRTEYLKSLSIQTVGSSVHREYWIPAERLDEFNRNVVGRIEIVARFADARPAP